MNTLATLQTIAKLDSEQVFRRVIDAALDSTTEQLLNWVRFAPEQFGIETPRHAPVLAKKINLPHYALLSDEAQDATIEKICKQIEAECGFFCSYVVDPAEGIISVYIASVEVNPSTLIELFEDEDEDLYEDEEDEDEDEDPDFLSNPEILIGCDILVNDLLRTVTDVDSEEMQALLDDDTSVDIDQIEIDDLDGSYFIPAPENFGVDRSVSDDSDEDEEDELDEEEEFDEEPAASVAVPQIRESEETNETGDDDFFEEELLQDSESNEPESAVADTEAEAEAAAIAAAILEEQTDAEPAPIDWTRPPVEPVQAQGAESTPEAADDDFAEEPQPESDNDAQNAPQEATEAPAEQPKAEAPATEAVSEAEQARRTEILENLKAELPNDSISEIKDNSLMILMVKNDTDYELTVTVTQQLFANERMIDIFVLTSKDGSVGRRASNAASILDAINSL